DGAQRHPGRPYLCGNAAPGFRCAQSGLQAPTLTDGPKLPSYRQRDRTPACASVIPITANPAGAPGATSGDLSATSHLPAAVPAGGRATVTAPWFFTAGTPSRPRWKTRSAVSIGCSRPRTRRGG